MKIILTLVKGFWFNQIFLPKNAEYLSAHAKAAKAELSPSQEAHTAAARVAEETGKIKFLDETRTKILALVPVIRLGRSRESDIFIDDGYVSSIHCDLITLPYGGWAAQDLASRYGTRVRRGDALVRIESGSFPLMPGDHLIIGNTIIKVSFTD